MAKELKPCPFCGNVNISERLYFVHNCMNDLPLLKLKIACSARDCGAKIELEEHTKNASFKEIESLFDKTRLLWNTEMRCNPMATCNDCLHVKICQKTRIMNPTHNYAPECNDFKDRSRFVELKHAEWDEHEDMYGDPVYCCSNCREKYFLEEWTPIENRYFYCPNCGAKMDERALKEAEV